MGQTISSAVAILIATFPASAQTTASETPAPSPCSFEVVSIHLASGDLFGYIHVDPNSTMLSASSATVKELVQAAYRTKDDRQVVGYPSWAATEKFDIVAKVPQEQAANKCLSDSEKAMGALRELLQQRFALKVQQKQRQIGVYGLWVIPGKLNLTPSEVMPEPAAHPKDDYMAIYPRYTLTAKRTTTTALARLLTGVVDRYVIDRTGLTARYTFNLKYVSDDPAISSLPEFEGRSSLFAALQEQLGLKLVPEETLMPVFVIDHVEHPSAN